MDFFFGELLKDARLDSKGQFTLDRERGLHLLARYRGHEPIEGLAYAWSAAQLAGATRIKAEANLWWLRVEDNGEPLLRAQAEGLMGHCLKRSDRRLHYLARALLAFSLLSHRSLTLASGNLLLTWTGMGLKIAELRRPRKGNLIRLTGYGEGLRYRLQLPRRVQQSLGGRLLDPGLELSGNLAVAPRPLQLVEDSPAFIVLTQKGCLHGLTAGLQPAIPSPGPFGAILWLHPIPSRRSHLRFLDGGVAYQEMHEDLGYPGWSAWIEAPNLELDLSYRVVIQSTYLTLLQQLHEVATQLLESLPQPEKLRPPFLAARFPPRKRSLWEPGGDSLGGLDQWVVSRNGRYLAVNTAQSFQVWDLKEGRQTLALEPLRRPQGGGSFAFWPGSNLLSVLCPASRRWVDTFDCKKGRVVSSYEHPQEVRRLFYEERGLWLRLEEESGQVVQLDTQSGEAQDGLSTAILSSESREVELFELDGRLLLRAPDWAISQALEGDWQGLSQGRLFGLQWSPCGTDRRVVSRSLESGAVEVLGRARLLALGERLQAWWHPEEGLSYAGRSLECQLQPARMSLESSDRVLVVASACQRLEVLFPGMKRSPQVLGRPLAVVERIRLGALPAGLVVATQDRLRIWDFRSGRFVCQPHSEDYCELQVAGDSLILAGVLSASLLNLEGEELFSGWQLLLLGEERLLARDSSGGVTIVDTSTREVQGTLPSGQWQLSEGGELLRFDGTVMEVWDPLSGQAWVRYLGPRCSVDPLRMAHWPDPFILPSIRPMGLLFLSTGSPWTLVLHFCEEKGQVLACYGPGNQGPVSALELPEVCPSARPCQGAFAPGGSFFCLQLDTSLYFFSLDHDSGQLTQKGVQPVTFAAWTWVGHRVALLDGPVIEFCSPQGQRLQRVILVEDDYEGRLPESLWESPPCPQQSPPPLEVVQREEGVCPDCREVYFTPDGERVVTWAREQLTGWSMTEGRVLWQLGQLSQESCIFQSPDGESLLLFDEDEPRRIRSYSMETGLLLRDTLGTHDLSQVFSWVGPSRLAAARQDGTLGFLDLDSGEFRRFDPQSPALEWVANPLVSPDGRWLVVTSDRGLWVLDLLEECLESIQPIPDYPLAWSGDGWSLLVARGPRRQVLSRQGGVEYPALPPVGLLTEEEALGDGGHWSFRLEFDPEAGSRQLRAFRSLREELSFELKADAFALQADQLAWCYQDSLSLARVPPVRRRSCQLRVKSKGSRLRFSRDGRWLAVLSADHRVELVEAQSLTRRALLGRPLLSGGQGTLVMHGQRGFFGNSRMRLLLQQGEVVGKIPGGGRFCQLRDGLAVCANSRECLVLSLDGVELWSAPEVCLLGQGQALIRDSSGECWLASSQTGEPALMIEDAPSGVTLLELGASLKAVWRQHQWLEEGNPWEQWIPPKLPLGIWVGSKYCNFFPDRQGHLWLFLGGAPLAFLPHTRLERPCLSRGERVLGVRGGGRLAFWRRQGQDWVRGRSLKIEPDQSYFLLEDSVAIVSGWGYALWPLQSEDPPQLHVFPEVE